MKKIALIMGLFLCLTLEAYSPVAKQGLKEEQIIAYIEAQKPKEEAIILFKTYNNNPFNIRNNECNRWRGKVSSKEPFERFQSLDYGLRAGFKLLQNYQRHYNLNTIEQIVYRFAPPFENDTESYINWMCDKTGFERNQPLDLHNKEVLIPFCKYMIELETGRPIHSNELTKVYTKYFT